MLRAKGLRTTAVTATHGLAARSGTVKLAPIDHGGRGFAYMASIKIRVTADGTFTIYRNGDAISSGLTRAQAERLAQVMKWIDPGA